MYSGTGLENRGWGRYAANRAVKLVMLSEFPPHPVARPAMYQSWEQLTFLHWNYDPAILRRMVPEELELDSFEGKAWVGLVPFRIQGVRPPLLPALRWMSRFPETNVRTYVRGPEGERGVWFFSLDAGRLWAVLGARLTYGLPYMWANMEVLGQNGQGQVRYQGRRRWPKAGAGSKIAVEPERPLASAELSDLDIFLTARFRLYTILLGRLAFAQVEHPPYPLMRARVLDLEEDLLAAAGLPPPRGEPLVHYSSGVHVRISAPQLVSRSGH